MGQVLVVIAILYFALGFNRARAYTKARRGMLERLLADPSPAAGAALRAVLALDRLPAWKRRSFLVLGFLVDLTAWPVSEILEPRDRRRRPEPWKPLFRDTRWPGSEEELTPEYASRRLRRCSLVAAGVAGYLTVTAGVFVSRLDAVYQIRWLVWVLVAGTAARQVQDLLDNKLLSTLARRSGLPVVHAYRDVVLSAAADVVTLSACAVLLLNWVPGESLRLAWFREQATAIVGGGHLWRAFTESPSAVLMGIATITFYASLITPLKATVGRRRSADDLMAAAESALRHGHPERARRLFELGRTKEPSAKAKHRVEGLLALAGGRVRDAWSAARTLVRLHRPDQRLDELREDEDGLFVVQHWCGELRITPSPSVLELARDRRVRDSMMACLVGQHVDALLPGSAPGARAAALEAVLDAREWPLTFSVVHVLDGNHDAAVRLLPPTDQVSGLDLLWRNQLSRDQRTVRDQEGLTEDGRRAMLAEHARALLDDVAASDATTWPEWHRSTFARAVSVPLLLAAAAGLDGELIEALRSTRRAIAGDLVDDAEIAVMRNFLSGPRGDVAAP